MKYSAFITTSTISWYILCCYYCCLIPTAAAFAVLNVHWQRSFNVTCVAAVKDTALSTPLEVPKKIRSSSICEELSDEDRWSDGNFEEMASAFNLDEEKRAKMKELQQRLSDINHWKNEPYEVYRYLKELHFDVKKTEEHFRDMIKWRIATHVDTYIERYGTPQEIFRYIPLFMLKGLDKEGDPIYIWRVGKFDAVEMIRRTGEEGIKAHYQFTIELATNRMHNIQGWNWQREYYEPLRGGRRFKQFTLIIDMDGFNTKEQLQVLFQPAIFSLLHHTAHLSAARYPGYSKRIIIIRAPSMFQLGWSTIAKNVCPPQVKEKVTVTNHENYLDVLDLYVDRTVLPSVICPQGKGEPMPGYFETIVMEGGKIPPSIHYFDRGHTNKPNPRDSSRVPSRT
jgi:hypothetical protein